MKPSLFHETLSVWTSATVPFPLSLLTHEMLTTLFRCAAWLLVAAIMLFTLSPIELRPTTEVPAHMERFAAFAVVGGAFWLGYPNQRFAPILLAIGIAGLLELLQDMIPGRHGRTLDFAVKAFGSLSGAACARLSEWLVDTVMVARRQPAETAEADVPPKAGVAVEAPAGEG